MIYKLLNKLFGWDYVHWRNSADSGIARVRTTPGGAVYYWRYKATRVMDVLPHPSITRITWLTCAQSKYITEDEE